MSHESWEEITGPVGLDAQLARGTPQNDDEDDDEEDDDTADEEPEEDDGEDDGYSE